MAENDGRTAGWPAPFKTVLGLTAEQHAAIAEDLLDGLRIDSVSEDAWDGRPPHQHYTSLDPDSDEPPDLGPFLAAITHALLAQAKAAPVPHPAAIDPSDGGGGRG